MEPIHLRDVAAAVGAASTNGPTVRAVCTDTRDIRPDSLFVALRGDTFDGHDYLAQAAAGGAVAALVDRDVPPVPGLTLVRVDDARRAMGRLATFVRRRFKGTVIAVAGSNGKTGTKHLIHAALSSTLRGSMSPKSFNNDVGVPVTLFAADPTDDFVVLEMGTNHPGEIAHLSRMAEPDIAVITNVGAEHLEFFGDLAGVARENAQVTAGMPPSGVVFVNGDQFDASRLDEPLDREVFTFGLGPHNQLFATDVTAGVAGVDFKVNGHPFHVPLLGRHTAANAMAAICLGHLLEVSYDDLRRGLATTTGPQWRLQLDRVGPIAVLNDAYNANPTSMSAALETLRDLPATGRRVAVLGDMLEMGDAAAAGHAEVGRLAAGLDVLVCVGPLSAGTAAAAKDAHVPVVYHVLTTTEAAELAPTLLRAGDLVLLKASRGLRLERVSAAIAAAFG